MGWSQGQGWLSSCHGTEQHLGQDKALSPGLCLAGPCCCSSSCSNPGTAEVLIPPVLEPSQQHSCQAAALSLGKGTKGLGQELTGVFLLLEGVFHATPCPGWSLAVLSLWHRVGSCCCFSCLFGVKHPPFPGKRTISAYLTASLKWVSLLI